MKINYAIVIRYMRYCLLSLFLIMLLAGTCYPGVTRGQQLGSRISITFNGHESLGTALSRFEKITGLQLAYDAKQLQLNRLKAPVVSLSNETAEKVLNRLLFGTHIAFNEEQGIIYLRKVRVIRPGRITGRVVDEKGEFLPGATLKVEETGQAIQSSVDGTYTLSLAPGTYTLSVSFISYQTQRITGVVVTEDKISYLNIAMKLAISSLKEVVVTSNFKKASVEGLYARQKNAAGITDGISAEQIGRTPDKNLGETLKRISGVSTLDNKYVVVRGLSERYNQAMLNGQAMPSTELNRKNFSFDLIPTSLVDNVVVTKSLTADQSAEFGGGLVQVNTKEIPDENGISVNFGSSVNDKTTGKLFRSTKIDPAIYWGNMPDSRSLFGNSNWKSRADIVNSGGLDKLNSLPNNWALHNYDPLPSMNGQLSVAHVFLLGDNKRLGVFASASYRDTWQTQAVRMSRDGYFGTNSASGDVTNFSGNRYTFTVNAGGMAGIGYSDASNKVSLQTLLMKTSASDLVFGTGQHEVARQSVGYYDLYTYTNLWQSQLKSEHKLGGSGLKAALSLSYTHLDKQRPDNHIANLSYTAKGDDTPLNPDADFTVTSGTSTGIDAGVLRSWNRALENDLAWNADLSMPYKFKIGDMRTSNVLKGGYSGWYKDRLFWVFLTGSKGFTSEPAPLSEVFDPKPGAVIYNSNFGDDFHGKPSLQAGYLMSDNKLGDKLRLVWGLRAEYYNVNRVSNVLAKFMADDAKNNPGVATNYDALYNREPNWNFFPSANLTYSLTPKMNLRASYAKSIIRPDLRELSFFHEYDFDLGGFYQSNSPILSTKINNYDLRYEWYPSAGELISVSAFYKKLMHPMEIVSDPNRIYELKNDYDAINKGIEVELRKSLAFTGIPFVKNITVFGNATRLFSKVRTMEVKYGAVGDQKTSTITVLEVPDDWQDRPQAGASNYTANAGLNYDQGAFSATASYNYVSNRFYRLGSSVTASLYEQPMQPLDAQLAYRLLKNKALVKLSISNLLASKYIVYQKHFEDVALESGQKQPTTQQLLYNKGQDWLDYEAATGRTYSLTFSYNF